MYTLPLQAITPSGDGWQYFACPGSVYISVTVLNGAVDIQYGQGFGVKASAAQFGPNPSTLTPGTDKQPRVCDLIRIRNHAPVSSPAPQVVIEAFQPGDIPKGVELGASFTPSYVVVGSDGSIGADFSGSVKGGGFLAPTTPAGRPMGTGTINTPPPGEIGFQDSSGVVRAGLIAYEGGTPDNVTVEAFAGPVNRFGVPAFLAGILDESGNSSFVRVPGQGASITELIANAATFGIRWWGGAPSTGAQGYTTQGNHQAGIWWHSGYRGAAGFSQGFVQVNGVNAPGGVGSSFEFNQINVHATFNPGFFLTNYAKGTALTLGISTDATWTYDSNDRWLLLILEYL